MPERNDAAPHKCPQCGEPGYLGFGVPAKCVQKGCMFYDARLWSDWAMLIPDDGDPIPFTLDLDWDEDTAPYGFALVKFRDFCSSCHVPVDFNRTTDPTSGTSFAFCPQCGQANVWS